MSNQRYSPEFKDEAVCQVIERGYSVKEVADRLGVSQHSLYKWVKDVKPEDKSEQQAHELVKAIKQQLAQEPVATKYSWPDEIRSSDRRSS